MTGRNLRAAGDTRVQAIVVGPLAALAVMAGVLAAPASAHTDKTASSATISWTGSGFEGDVESSQPCIVKRKVSLFRRGDNGALARAKTDANGNWQIDDIERVNGDYHVKVAKRVLKRNRNHKHICKRAAPKANKDAKVRDCDEVTLFGGDASPNVDVDDDIRVDLEGETVFLDSDGFATSHPPISLGPISFGESIRIVATNGPFGGPIGLDPLHVECSSASGSGSEVLDPTGVPPGGDEDPGFVFYDETYDMPTINLR